MIVDKLENISKYGNFIPDLSELDFLKNLDFGLLNDGKSCLSETFDIVKIDYKFSKDHQHFKLLEAHKNNTDIHITIKGLDKIVFRKEEECIDIHEDYNTEHDYTLYKDKYFGSMIIPNGYFVLIPPGMAHMALMSNENVQKVVVKFNSK
jgi:YhcH/YjgK/YiaL family protein